MEKEPANLQAQSLGQLIDKRAATGESLRSDIDFVFTNDALGSFVDGYIGMALAGGAAAVGAIILAGLIRRAARK